MIYFCVLLSEKYYGNTGCQVFKQGVQNWKDFPLKINIPKKILNFENQCNGEVPKSASKSFSIFFNEKY